MVEEAHLEQTAAGLRPRTEGWFVINTREASWETSSGGNAQCSFEGPEAWSRALGITLQVLEPGRPNCLYHRESNEEAFLVLAGECLLLVEGQERVLRPWDFFRCPPGTEHVFVGAGEQPCVVVMVGTRSEEEEISYPLSPLADRYGASVKTETDSPEEAYSGFPPYQPGRPPSWRQLPWNETTS